MEAKRSAHKASIEHHHNDAAAHGPTDGANIAVRRAVEETVKAMEKPPVTVPINRVSQSAFAVSWCGLSKMAASAGESVSELMAERMVEIAMVNAN